MTALKTLIQTDYLIFDNVIDMTLTPDSGTTQTVKALRHAVSRQSLQAAAAQAIELQADDTEIEVFTATLGGTEIRKANTLTEGSTVWWVVMAYKRTMDSRYTCVCRLQPT